MQVISKADFIATVVNFDTDSLTSAVIRTVEDVFSKAGDLTADAVTRASKACGPLFMVNAAYKLPRITAELPSRKLSSFKYLLFDHSLDSAWLIWGVSL